MPTKSILHKSETLPNFHFTPRTLMEQVQGQALRTVLGRHIRQRPCTEKLMVWEDRSMNASRVRARLQERQSAEGAKGEANSFLPSEGETTLPLQGRIDHHPLTYRIHFKHSLWLRRIPWALRRFHTQVEERAPRLVCWVPAPCRAQLLDLRYLWTDGAPWRRHARALTGSETVTKTNSTANLTVLVIKIPLAQSKWKGSPKKSVIRIINILKPKIQSKRDIKILNKAGISPCAKVTCPHLPYSSSSLALEMVALWTW